MSKATPIENLPTPSSNVQMQINPQQPQMQQSIQPQPPIEQQNINSSQLRMDRENENEGQRINTQNHFVNRQFVPQSGMAQNNSNYTEQNYNQYPNYQQPIHTNNDNGLVNNKETIFQLVMSKSKILLLIFALILTSQLETTQGIFRKITRTLNVPDNMVFMVSKLLISIVGIIVFFFVQRNI